MERSENAGFDPITDGDQTSFQNSAADRPSATT